MKVLSRKARWIIAWSLAAVCIFIFASNWWVISSTKSNVRTDYSELPDSSVVLVLGTSNKLTNGSPNPYFQERIRSAAELYKQGKAIHFLLSGDNRTRYYNEPEEMRKALIKAGVPGRIITLDHAGLRTLDSIVRSKEIFGQNQLIIVTQPFHCYRALFISHFYQIEAVAFVANDSLEYSEVKANTREWLARAKAVLDLYVLKTEPHHLGSPEPLQIL